MGEYERKQRKTESRVIDSNKNRQFKRTIDNKINLKSSNVVQRITINAVGLTFFMQYVQGLRPRSNSDVFDAMVVYTGGPYHNTRILLHFNFYGVAISHNTQRGPNLSYDQNSDVTYAHNGTDTLMITDHTSAATITLVAV